MEECKSSSPTVHDVEEGEISDSASSVEEISEEAFNKRESSPTASSASATATTPTAPFNTNSANTDINNINNNHLNSPQKQRVWTMRDLYQYHSSRKYSAGLYNLAWASAVQNKPLDEVLVMEFPKAANPENNGGNSILKRAGSEGPLTLNSDKEAQAEVATATDNPLDNDMIQAEGKGEEEEKEEGELEEGEIDFDSEMVVEVNVDASGDKGEDKKAHVDQSLDLVRKGLESVTTEKAEKSFGEVSTRIQNLLEIIQEIADNNLQTAKDVLVPLAFSAIRTVNIVFCSMDRSQKQSNKEIISRLLAHASKLKHPLFSVQQLREIGVMVSAVDSSSIFFASMDSYRNKEMKELEVLSKNDFDLSSRSVKRVTTNIVDMDTITVKTSDQPEPQILQENTKLTNSKWRGMSLPLLDLHKDHDADSLPSPTRGGPSSLSNEKGLAVGCGLLKPEWPVPRVVIDRDSVPMHPYETDAIEAVSSYQQKFGSSSFFMNDRLPSPTPSEEGDVADGDMSGEVSSSSNMKVNPVNTIMVGMSTVSSAPKMDIPGGQELINAWNASQSSCGPNPSLKSPSLKSRDPRLRWANSDASGSNCLLPVIKHEHKGEPVGGTINSRKQKTVQDLFFCGPALKRNRAEQTEVINDVQGVTGTSGCLEDRGIVGLGTANKSNELKNNGIYPRRRPEYAVTGVSSSSSISNITVNSNENLPATTPSPTASLHSLLKDIAVNPSIWMNIIKMEQQKSANTAQTTTQPMGTNPIFGAVPSTNVVASKPHVAGEKMAGMHQMTPQSSSVDELGKVCMKPRDPRRVLHSNTVQKGGNLELNQSLTKTSTSSTSGITSNSNFQRQDDQLDKKCMSSHNIVPPDIARQFRKNLKNIADIVSVTQATPFHPVLPGSSSSPPVQAHQGRMDAVTIVESGNPQNVPGRGSSLPQNDWDDVEHLFEGFDDQQKAAILKERARRLEEQRKMFSARKLCLVLDLDHTLLNSAKFAEVDPIHDEMLRKKEEQDREKSQRHLFRFPHMGMWTKLRPGIWNFLDKASKLYELHLYTMGNKLYATEMAKLLDPKGELFAGRVISRGDDGDLLDGDERIPKSKDLEGVMGMESAVVIIDDSMRVWPHNKLNLIVVERYIYFPCSRRQFGLPGPSLLEIDHDERPEDGTLASSLAVIERMHQIFFGHQSLDEADVRNILASEQRKILAGCRILFSRVFPVGEANPHLHPLWQTAEQFGAVCTNSVDEQVTHVVANSLGTDKVNWALSTGRFVVHPGWVEASALLYRRASELDFAIKP